MMDGDRIGDTVELSAVLGGVRERLQPIADAAAARAAAREPFVWPDPPAGLARTSDGLLLYAEDYAALGLLADGRRVILRTPTDRLNPRVCYNCGGNRTLRFAVVVGTLETFINVAGSDNSIMSNPTGPGWLLTVNQQFNCPICQADYQLRLAALRSQCGLTSDQLRYEANRLAGEPGKEEWLGVLWELLQQGPTPKGLYYVHGAYGVGKSGGAAALVAAMVNAGVPAYFVEANQLHIDLRATFDRTGGSDAQTESKMLSVITRYNVLVIDELDLYPKSTEEDSWGYNIMRTILNRRVEMRNQYLTILISNRSPARLGPEWGYLVDRLHLGRVVPVKGESLRKQGG